MKINLSERDLNRAYGLLDNKEINISIADLLMSIYEEKEYFVNTKEPVQFFNKMVQYFQIPPQQKDDILILEKWVKPYIFPLKPTYFSENPYYRHVTPRAIKQGKYELSYLSYKPYQPLPLDDISVDEKDGYVEHTPIGYFTDELKYLSLSYDGVTWMCITPNEINTMKPHIESATGNVLVFGLGLGYYIYMASLKDDVKDIYVVELDQNIIDIFNSIILPFFEKKDKIHIIHGDAKEYIKNMNKPFNTVFIDLWHNAEDGLPLYLYFKGFEKKYPNSKFQYWLEESIIALYRRYLLTIFEESLNGYSDKDYQRAKNEEDKLINSLYFKTKNITINKYDDIYKLLSKESILRLI